MAELVSLGKLGKDVTNPNIISTITKKMEELIEINQKLIKQNRELSDEMSSHRKELSEQNFDIKKQLQDQSLSVEKLHHSFFYKLRILASHFYLIILLLQIQFLKSIQ